MSRRRDLDIEAVLDVLITLGRITDSDRSSIMEGHRATLRNELHERDVAHAETLRGLADALVPPKRDRPFTL